MTLNDRQDAFGNALIDAYQGNLNHDLVLEVDDGRTFPAMSPDWFLLSPDEWHPWEREQLKQLAGPVLDLGTGAGRAALFLQTQGVAVTALDYSPGAIEVCRRRGVHDARLHDFLVDLPTDQRWRAILLLCGNFGLAGGWDETKQFLRNLRGVCEEGAILIGDTVDPTLDTDEATRVYQQHQLEAGGYVGDVGLRLKYGKTTGAFWRQSNFRVEDIASLVKATGWNLVDHHVGGMDHYVRLEAI